MEYLLLNFHRINLYNLMYCTYLKIVTYFILTSLFIIYYLSHLLSKTNINGPFFLNTY